MKKIFIVIICSILMLSFSTVAFASENVQFANAGELFQHWYANQPNYETSPYPDYICGVWSTDGGMENLTFAVTKDEAGEAGKQEILSLIEDTSTVSFTYGSYSFAELWEIYLELQQRLGDETGTYGIGIYEMDNVIYIEYDASSKNSKAFIEECFNRFGDRILFESGSGTTLTSAQVITGGGSNNDWFMWVFCIVLLFGVGTYMMNKKRRMLAMQTVGGNIVTWSSAPSKKAVVTAIKKNQSMPSDSTFASIIDKIDKPNE